MVEIDSNDASNCVLVIKSPLIVMVEIDSNDASNWFLVIKCPLISFNNSLDFGDAELSVYDAQGRLVRNYKTFIDKIDVSGLTSGIYMLNIKLNDGTYSETKKIVINR